MRSKARCSGCGASYDGADKGAWMDFMKEHALHGAHCPKCGALLSVVNQVGTCPSCGAKVPFNVSVTQTSEKKKLGHTLFGR